MNEEHSAKKEQRSSFGKEEKHLNKGLTVATILLELLCQVILLPVHLIKGIVEIINTIRS